MTNVVLVDNILEIQSSLDFFAREKFCAMEHFLSTILAFSLFFASCKTRNESLSGESKTAASGGSSLSVTQATIADAMNEVVKMTARVETEFVPTIDDNGRVKGLKSADFAPMLQKIEIAANAFSNLDSRELSRFENRLKSNVEELKKSILASTFTIAEKNELSKNIDALEQSQNRWTFLFRKFYRVVKEPKDVGSDASALSDIAWEYYGILLSTDHAGTKYVSIPLVSKFGQYLIPMMALNIMIYEDISTIIEGIVGGQLWEAAADVVVLKMTKLQHFKSLMGKQGFAYEVVNKNGLPAWFMEDDRRRLMFLFAGAPKKSTPNGLVDDLPPEIKWVKGAMTNSIDNIQNVPDAHLWFLKYAPVILASIDELRIERGPQMFPTFGGRKNVSELGISRKLRRPHLINELNGLAESLGNILAELSEPRPATF